MVEQQQREAKAKERRDKAEAEKSGEQREEEELRKVGPGAGGRQMVWELPWWKGSRQGGWSPSWMSVGAGWQTGQRAAAASCSLLAGQKLLW